MSQRGTTGKVGFFSEFESECEEERGERAKAERKRSAAWGGSGLGDLWSWSGEPT